MSAGPGHDEVDAGLATPTLAAAGWRRWLTPEWRPACLLAALAGCLAGFSVVYANWDMMAGHGGPSLRGVDDTGYYIWLRSGVIDGDFDFANDVSMAPTVSAKSKAEWLALPRTVIGRVPNKFPPGWALATLPAFLVGHGVALATGAAADGWSPPYFVAIWTYHLALAVVGLWCALRVVGRFARPSLAVAAVLALWVASPLIYYQTARVGMAHGLLFTLVAAVFDQALKLRDGDRATWRWGLVGGVCGLMILVRATAVLYAFFPCVVLIARLRSEREPSRWKMALAMAIPLICAALLGATSIWVQHGAIWVEPYPGERFEAVPHIFGVLFSPFHGLFYWHPLILLGLAGALGAMARRHMPLSWALILVAVTWVNGAWHAWWFGSSFGNRAFEGAVLFAMAGLAWLGEKAVAGGDFRRRCFWAVTGGLTAAGAWLLVLFVTQAIPREEPVTYGDMMRAGVRQILHPAGAERTPVPLGGATP
jgi:hypothetical protein